MFVQCFFDTQFFFLAIRPCHSIDVHRFFRGFFGIQIAQIRTRLTASFVALRGRWRSRMRIWWKGLEGFQDVQRIRGRSSRVASWRPDVLRAQYVVLMTPLGH